MSKKSVSYSAKLFNRNGGKTNLRYALSFDLFYGKRKVLSKQPFPRYAKSSFTKETTEKKRKYILRLTKQVEKKRLQALEMRRKIAAEKRELKRREEELKKLQEIQKKKRRVERKIRVYKEAPSEPVSTPAEEEAARRVSPLSLKQFQLADLESIRWDKGREEPPEVFPAATVQDVLIFPVDPVNDLYEKRIIEKTLSRNEGRDFDYLTIMDFSLLYDIVMNDISFNQAAQEIYDTFMPHIGLFWSDIHETKPWFILRMKFRYAGGKDGAYVTHGLSMPRYLIRTATDLHNFVVNTIKLFRGHIVKGKLIVKNYLTGDQDLYVTGFTLEAGDISSNG